MPKLRMLSACVLISCLLTASVTASDKKKPDASQSAAATTATAPSAAEIAKAQAEGKVWVNLDSGIYHKSGRWYGKTKNGKFMSENDAKKAGYQAAKRE